MNDQEFGDHITELVQMRDTLTPEDFANRVVALSSELTIARNAESRARLAAMIDAKLPKAQLAAGRRPGRPPATPVYLPKPECRLGYTVDQVRAILGDRYNEFWAWGSGCTAALCQGKECGTPHGAAIYLVDLEQFLRGGRPLD